MEAGTTFLWELAAEIALTREAHHVYPYSSTCGFPEAITRFPLLL